MPERGFSTDFWADTFVESLSAEGRYLFTYLWTNPHCNQAGLYEITQKRIADETKLPLDNLPALMKSLEPKVKWYQEQNLVWVKNFLKRQAKSPKFLVAAAKSLSTIHHKEAVEELIKFNMQKYSISIPYEYSMDSVSIPSTAKANAVSSANSNSGKKDEVVKGKGKEKKNSSTKDIPHSKSEAEESLCEGDHGAEVAPKGAGVSHRAEGDEAIISVWCSVKGFSMSPADASALVARLRTEFPDVDILQESKTWAARKLTEPLKPGSRPSQQIWHWMQLARKYAQERRQGAQDKGQRAKVHGREDFRGDW